MDVTELARFWVLFLGTRGSPVSNVTPHSTISFFNWYSSLLWQSDYIFHQLFSFNRYCAVSLRHYVMRVLDVVSKCVDFLLLRSPSPLMVFGERSQSSVSQLCPILPVIFHHRRASCVKWYYSVTKCLPAQLVLCCDNPQHKNISSVTFTQMPVILLTISVRQAAVVAQRTMTLQYDRPLERHS